MLDILLEYAYNREVTITCDNVQELLPAADQFNIDGIVFKCCAFLEQCLDPSNCIGLRRYAQFYFCKALEEAALNYILQNFESIIMEKYKDEFLELAAPEFAELLSYDELNIRSEEAAFEAIVQWIEHDPLDRALHIIDLLGKLRLGLMDTEYFMHNVRNNPYVRQIGEPARPLIREALQILHRLELSSDALNDEENVMSRPRLPHEVLFAIGGWSGGSPTNSIEAYDSRANCWVSITNRIQKFAAERPRAYHGVVFHGHSVYIVGGFDGQNYFNSMRRIDLKELDCFEEPPMSNRRCYISVCILEKFIYAMGGMDGHSRLKNVERYDIEQRSWEMLPDMNERRSDASSTACSVLKRVYCAGGFNGQECLFTAEFYCPISNVWTNVTPMRSRRSGVSLVAYKSDVYAVGGFDGTNRLKTCEVYSPEGNSWKALSLMINPRSNFGIEILDGTIMAVGGFNGFQTTYNVEQYDIELDEWYEVQDMSVFRSALSCTLIKDIDMKIIKQFCAPRKSQN